MSVWLCASDSYRVPSIIALLLTDTNYRCEAAMQLVFNAMRCVSIIRCDESRVFRITDVAIGLWPHNLNLSYTLAF